jgi:hypothetical protein
MQAIVVEKFGGSVSQVFPLTENLAFTQGAAIGIPWEKRF